MLIERMRDRGSGIDSGGIHAADAVQGYTAVHVMLMSNKGVVYRSEIMDGTEERLLAGRLCGQGLNSHTDERTFCN